METKMNAVAVFTNRGLNCLLAEGGTQAWVLNPERVRKLTYVVCAQNREDGSWGEPTHSQGQGFLIGRISTVDASPEPGREDRFIIRFDEYAEIDVPHMAYQWRNPVRYIRLEDHGIDPKTLTFLPLEQSKSKSVHHDLDSANSAAPSIRPLDMASAKRSLAAFYNVPVNSIEITIRG